MCIHYIIPYFVIYAPFGIIFFAYHTDHMMPVMQRLRPLYHGMSSAIRLTNRNTLKLATRLSINHSKFRTIIASTNVCSYGWYAELAAKEMAMSVHGKCIVRAHFISSEEDMDHAATIQRNAEHYVDGTTAKIIDVVVTSCPSSIDRDWLGDKLKDSWRQVFIMRGSHAHWDPYVLHEFYNPIFVDTRNIHIFDDAKLLSKEDVLSDDTAVYTDMTDIPRDVASTGCHFTHYDYTIDVEKTDVDPVNGDVHIIERKQ